MHYIMCDACGQDIPVKEQGTMVKITVFYKDNGGVSRQKDKELHAKCWRQTERGWDNQMNTKEASE